MDSLPLVSLRPIAPLDLAPHLVPALVRLVPNSQYHRFLQGARVLCRVSDRSSQSLRRLSCNRTTSASAILLETLYNTRHHTQSLLMLFFAEPALS